MHSITSGLGLARSRDEKRNELCVASKRSTGSFQIYSKYAEQRRIARANTDKRCASREARGWPSFRLVRQRGWRAKISSKKSGGDRRFCLPTKRRKHETIGIMQSSYTDIQTDKQPPTTRADDEPFSRFLGLATGGHYTRAARGI